MTQERIDKLPKWAQQEVKTLMMRLEEAKSELERINDNPVSNTIVGFDQPMFETSVKYLNNNQMITFMLPTGKMSARIDHDCIEINGHGHVNMEFAIRPSASNACRLKFVSR